MRKPKAKNAVKSAMDRERAKTEELLAKVGYTALKKAGVKPRRPDLPDLKIEKRGK